MTRPALSRNDVEVVPVTATSWHLFEELFGPNGLQGGCWCAYFRMTAREFDRSTPTEHKQHVRQVVRANRPFGLLAVLDGQAQGWIAVAPRLDNSRLKKSRVARVPEDEDLSDIWSITCFYTRRGTRRGGITGVLLHAAVKYATDHGARAVEGYPVDASIGKLASGDLYHGELQTFLNGGFELIEHSGTRRALVRKTP